MYFCAIEKKMTVSEVRELIVQKQGVVLYFKNDKCGPCMVLRPKVESLIKEEFPKMNFQIVDIVDTPILASEYNVFANPTILVFFEGKEYIRKSKYIGTLELAQEISRIYKMVF